MKREFNTTNAKFVYTKNELGYQEVLDDMSSAEEITIVTFNISERNVGLVNALRSVGQHCKVNIITNIPIRWETYYGDAFRLKARDKINLYLSKLNPEKLGKNTEVFFDFSNHGKIIMTNNVAYIGSANYSEESAQNTEFGFISRDLDFISYIQSEVLPVVKDYAIPFYEYDYTPLLLEANVALSALFNARNRLYEDAYSLYDDFEGECYYYNEDKPFLSNDLLELITQIVDESVKIASYIYDAIDVITKGDDNELDLVNESYEELRGLGMRIEEIATWDSLSNLAEFDNEEYVHSKLQEEYAMEAYEDNLEDCIKKVSNEASDIIFDLTSEAHEDIDILIKEIDNFSNAYSVYLQDLQSREIKKINDEIDNTK